MDNKIPETTAELAELLRATLPQKKNEYDYTTLRYKIYARKSTTGDERQERSIEDQIDDCIFKVVSPNELITIGDRLKKGNQLRSLVSDLSLVSLFKILKPERLMALYPGTQTD